MNAPPKEPIKRKYGLLILAIALLLFAGAALVVSPHDVAIRSLGMLAIVISVYCVRLSKAAGAGSTMTTIQQTASSLPTRSGRSVWIVSILLVPLFGMSFAWLYSDAVQGYHQILPVYCFAGAAIVCALCWSYLVARLLYAR